MRGPNCTPTPRAYLLWNYLGLIWNGYAQYILWIDILKVIWNRNNIVLSGTHSEYTSNIWNGQTAILLLGIHGPVINCCICRHCKQTIGDFLLQFTKLWAILEYVLQWFHSNWPERRSFSWCAVALSGEQVVCGHLLKGICLLFFIFFSITHISAIEYSFWES